MLFSSISAQNTVDLPSVEGDSLLPWLQEVASYLAEGDQLVVVDASEKLKNNELSELFFNHNQVHYLKANKGRALQMNAGAEFLLSNFSGNSEPSLLWFLHSDSGLSGRHLEYLRGLIALKTQSNRLLWYKNLTIVNKISIFSSISPISILLILSDKCKKQVRNNYPLCI